MDVLDLFSGIGSFSLGFQRAGYTIKRFCEIEDHCVKVLNKNFPDIDVDRDIKNLSWYRRGLRCAPRRLSLPRY